MRSNKLHFTFSFALTFFLATSTSKANEFAPKVQSTKEVWIGSQDKKIVPVGNIGHGWYNKDEQVFNIRSFHHVNKLNRIKVPSNVANADIIWEGVGPRTRARRFLFVDKHLPKENLKYGWVMAAPFNYFITDLKTNKSINFTIKKSKEIMPLFETAPIPFLHNENIYLVIAVKDKLLVLNSKGDTVSSLIKKPYLKSRLLLRLRHNFSLTPNYNSSGDLLGIFVIPKFERKGTPQPMVYLERNGFEFTRKKIASYFNPSNLKILNFKDHIAYIQGNQGNVLLSKDMKTLTLLKGLPKRDPKVARLGVNHLNVVNDTLIITDRISPRDITVYTLNDGSTTFTNFQISNSRRSLSSNKMLYTSNIFGKLNQTVLLIYSRESFCAAKLEVFDIKSGTSLKKATLKIPEQTDQCQLGWSHLIQDGKNGPLIMGSDANKPRDHYILSLFKGDE